MRLAGRLGLPAVATHPVQFLRPEDHKAHEARVCIAEGYVLADRRRPRAFTADSYFKTQAEMAQAFADLPEALANSVEIARRCNLALELGKSRLPEFPTPPGSRWRAISPRSPSAASRAGWSSSTPTRPRARRRRRAIASGSRSRSRTIVQMGFAGYFLIVADFINWAKDRTVFRSGPGRGSGAGSLVAYALGITDLDPLRYDLLFERFLNPERVSMPDFDIDFCQDGRDKVIEYVKQKYGAESVSQIATFGTMAAKAVVRDVGRVMEWPYTRADELAKLIPFQPGKLITLKAAREMEPRLKEREETEEDTRELLALAEDLEGLTRNVGMHAGGVLIAPGKLTDFCPLYAAHGSESVVSQLDMKGVEAVGLVKFDFLGLTTLTILDWTVRYARRLDPSSTLSLDRLPLDDKETYRIFQAANAAAVFQFESRGMRDLLKRARPDRFEDLIALVALYRPGPMDLIPDFIERKHGRQRVEYLDPRLETILGPTYGVMVYQEQVMQIAQVIGGYSLGSADLLRRAMGKKLPEEMATQRDAFVEGALKNGLTPRKANELFDLMEKFAGYGFNKSHAAAYALVAYQTAYMKAHHAAAFMAANLSALMDDTDKVQSLYQDVVANGLKMLPPDINAGEYRFVPVDARTIRYGLGAVKGTGESAITAILKAREEGGPFADLFDFCERIDKRIVNRRSVEALVRAGAFDAIDANRARLFASVGIALEAAEQRARDAQQVSLFGEAAARSASGVRRGGALDRAAAAGGGEGGARLLPLGPSVRRLPARVRAVRPDDARRARPRGSEPQLLAGMVAVGPHRDDPPRQDGGRDARRRHRADRGVGLQRAVGRGPRPHQGGPAARRRRARCRRTSSPAASGSSPRSSTTSPGARARFARAIRLSMNGEASMAGGAAAKKLKELLGPYRNGNCAVRVSYRHGEAVAELRLGDEWRVSPDDALIASLRDWLAPENVEVVYG